MAEQDSDVTDATPSQEALSVTGAAQQLLDRFPEESGTESDPKVTETEESESTAEASVDSEDTDSGGLEDEPVETPEPPPLHKVMVDGVEREITVAEALRGYSRTADYSHKTMQLADERRKVEAEVQGARQARDAYAEKLTLVDQALADEPEPDWVKARTDMSPEDFLNARADWQIKQEQRQKVTAERKRVTDEQAKEAAQREQVYLDGEAESLREAIPDFADAEKAGKLKADLVAYGETQHFTRDELAGVRDHRALVILDKARKYDAIVARKTETTKQATPTVAPGARPPNVKGAKTKKAKKEAQDRLARTGRVDDAVEALLHMDD